MNKWELDSEQLDAVFRDWVRPLLLGELETGDRPSFTLVVGQPGAGEARVTGRLLEEATGQVAVLRAEDLEAFHPNYIELLHSHSDDAARALSAAAAELIQRALAFARGSNRSLIVEGNLASSPDLVRSLAGSFAKRGYRTRIVVTATSRASSLLASSSRHLLTSVTRRSSIPPTLDSHEQAYRGARELVRDQEADPSVDRLTIVSPDGHYSFDGDVSEGYTGASSAFDKARSGSMASWRAMRWLSELRAATDYATNSGEAAMMRDLLIAAHEEALRTVVPSIALPDNSRAGPVLEATIARRLLALRQLRGIQRIQLTEPQIAATAPSTERGIGR